MRWCSVGPASSGLICATRCSPPDTAVVCVDNFCTGDPGNIEHLIGQRRLRPIDHDVTASADPGRSSTAVDVVFHLASAASPRAYHRLPIETLRAGSLGTEHGLQLAERLRRPLRARLHQRGLR